MAPLNRTVFPFASKGIVQKLDPSLVDFSQYVQLHNVEVRQEGALSSRRGGQRISAVPGESLVHSCAILRTSGNIADTYLYAGAGENIYRSRYPFTSWSQISYGSTPWGTDWDACEYHTGETGVPRIYIAAGQVMAKNDGSSSTLTRWGIEPPNEPAEAEVEPSTPIYIMSGDMEIVASSDGWWNGRYDLQAPADLSPGGDPDRGYASKDPIVLTVSLPDPYVVDEIRLFIGVGDGTVTHYYSKSIVPSSLAGYVAREQAPQEAAQQMVSGIEQGAIPGYEWQQPYEPGAVPAELPPWEPAQPLTAEVRIPKQEFLGVGKAGGESPYNWSSVYTLYVLIKFNQAGSATISNVYLDGRYGPDNDDASWAEYSYVYTYKNSNTLTESNPSPLMSYGVRSSRRRIKVTVSPSSDPQVDKIVIYRRGGSFDDAYFRMVGEMPNSQSTFYDEKSDLEIAAAPVAEFDNFPPPPGRICATAFDSVFVAGIEGMPHVLAKSKTGRPESFPIVVEATGQPHRVNVGSPSNPIMAITEFGGAVVCLNRHSIYVVGTWLGGLKAPVEAPAGRGLVASKAWCRAENEIWFLSYDGVYSWSGGAARLRSAAIDWMFKGQTVNGIAPIDMSYASSFRMGHHSNYVWLIARDTAGNHIALVCDTFGQQDRWYIWQPSVPSGETASNWTAVVTDESAGVMYSFRSVTGQSGTQAYLYRELQVNGTDDGAPIPWKVLTGWLSSRDIEGHFSDFSLEYQSADSLTLRMYRDYASSPDVSFSLPSASGRSRKALFFDTQQGPDLRKANAVSFQIEGSGQATLYSFIVNSAPLAQRIEGRIEDWDDLGYPYDKRLDLVTIEYDTGGQSATVYLDIIYGPGGNSQENAVATFTLTGTGRSKATFSIPPRQNGSAVIAKMVRLRYKAGSEFTLFNRVFSFEKYPPDIVLYTSWTDSSYPFEKIYQQVLLDIDTGGVAATVYVDIDGVQKQQLSVNSTEGDRIRILTLAPGIIGKLGRLRFVPGNGGKTQLFSWNFVVTPANPGATVHTWAWDDLGHPHDKELFEVMLEYEVTENTSVKLYGLSGIGNDQSEWLITQFDLTAGGRRRLTVPLPANVIVKMVRFQPTATNVDFRSWKYSFQQLNYPPDIVPVTTWKAEGQYPVYFEQLVMEVDTGGVAASVYVDVDGIQKATFSVSTTRSSRMVTLTLPPGISGRMARIRASAGTGGKFQLFNYWFVTAPADHGPVIHTTGWDDLGHAHDKQLVSGSVEYEVDSSTSMKLYALIGPIGSQTEQLVATIDLTAGGRRKHSFPLPKDLVVKAIRFEPTSTTATFKAWKYKFDTVNLPPDVILATPWDEVGYPFEKILKEIVLDVNTGGNTVNVTLEVDGEQKYTFPITTSLTDRSRVIAVPSGIMGYRFRLSVPPGTGMFQVFSVRYACLREPAAVTHWDTYDLTVSQSETIIKKLWIKYVAPDPVSLSVFVDHRKLSEYLLPASAVPSVRMFLLPSRNNGAVNRGRIIRLVADSVSPFKIYSDGSALEFLPLAGSERASYSKLVIAEVLGTRP